MNIERKKYNRTFHLPFSLGQTDDDKTLSDCSIFEGKDVVVTVKVDGENSNYYSDGYFHARSLDSKSHESRDYVKKYLKERVDLPKNWRICGENLYAKHSIHYTNLKGYFYIFSIWNELNECLSWDDTLEWGNLMYIPVVDELYRGIWDEGKIKSLYTSFHNGCECEGFVVRTVGSFKYEDFQKNVAKFVRKNHVITSNHWMQEKIIKNILQ